VDAEEARRIIFDNVAKAAPGAVEMITDIVEEVLKNRESAGWLALIGVGTLAFSASGAFDALDKAINRAWGTETVPNILVAKLTSFAMLGVIALLLVLALIISTVLKATRDLTATYLGSIPGDAYFWQAASLVASLAVIFLGFCLLFRFIPRCPVRMRDVWPAALFTAVVWTLAKEVFAFFLGTSFANFSAVYGTLGTVIALLTWIYVSAIIILTGAELSAEIARMRRHPVLKDDAGEETSSSRKPSPWLRGR
jgi:membrane protein